MAYIKFSDSKEFIPAVVLPTGNHVVKITADIAPNLTGFRLYLRDDDRYPLDNGEYESYTTLYRQGGGWFELSNDGSVYEEPPEVIPETLTEEQKAELERRQKIADISGQIANLKVLLESSDYQIIKAYEYSLVGKETEYDMEVLHQERQNLRNQINKLEIQLVELAIE